MTRHEKGAVLRDSPVMHRPVPEEQGGAHFAIAGGKLLDAATVQCLKARLDVFMTPE